MSPSLREAQGQRREPDSAHKPGGEGRQGKEGGDGGTCRGLCRYSEGTQASLGCVFGKGVGGTWRGRCLSWALKDE